MSKSPDRTLLRKQKRCAFTLLELLTVITIIAILVGLLLPAIQSSREAARRTGCLNNLRQLGLGLHQFESVHRVFPASGWTRVGPGNPNGKFVGWRPLLLPYIEQQNVRSLYNIDRHWWEQPNVTVAAIPVATFRCPSSVTTEEVTSAAEKFPRPAMTFSNPIAGVDYEALMGVKPDSINPHLATPRYDRFNRFGVMHRNSRTTFASIHDGTSNSILLTECSARPFVYRRRAQQSNLTNDQGIGWADSEGPFSLDGATRDGSREGWGAACNVAINARNDNEPFSFHPSVSNFLFADARAETLSEKIELSVLAALATRASGERVSDRNTTQ